MRLILASASPRRRELLSQLGVEFEVCPSQGEEKITEHLPELAVMQLAQQKAADIAGKTEGDAWILGADTIVVYDQKILGKENRANKRNAGQSRYRKVLKPQISGDTGHILS